MNKNDKAYPVCLKREEIAKRFDPLVVEVFIKHVQENSLFKNVENVVSGG